MPEAEQQASTPLLTSPAPGEPGLPEPIVAAKRALIGRPLETGQLEERLLPKFLALPIFSSDPISSVAYATEAALAVLIAASVAAAHLVLPISVAISVLLLIVVLSYRQGIAVYQSSGGSYVFAKENHGTTPALVAAASLLTTCSQSPSRWRPGSSRSPRSFRRSPRTRWRFRSSASSFSRSEICVACASRASSSPSRPTVLSPRSTPSSASGS